ncbi:MAG: VTT domain-containing protein [Bacteroidia bacterium]|nr:VTT domain-containing protein [Bacteroidia bacterium]
MNELFEIVLHTDDYLMRIVAENVIEAYLILFLVIFLETGTIFFPFLPGDGLLFSAGVITASTSLNIVLLVPILILAAVLGNLSNYFVGSFFGDKLEKSQNRFVQKYLMKYIIQTRHFYNKYGAKSIVIGRFFPVIRTYIPFFAGLSGFKYHIFLVFTIIGSALWVPFFTLTGYFIGENAWVKENYLIIFLGLIIVTLMPFFYSVIKLAFTRKK